MNMATWVEWSDWFSEASDDEDISALELALMVHIAGWAENVGTGWGIDDGVIDGIARRLETSPDQISKAFRQLQRHGYVSLTVTGVGKVLFPRYGTKRVA
jgi:hypothetical protein